MKLIIVGGPPSTGKTSAIIHSLNILRKEKYTFQVIKLDCLTANDEEMYKKNNIRIKTGLSTYVCPDHFLASNIERITEYGLKSKFDFLVIESAGLCNRCSPFLKHNLAAAVLDMSAGILSPMKIGPLLKNADAVLLTHGDMISQAEREVFHARISRLNRKSMILEVNGLTGQKCFQIADLFKNAKDFNKSIPLELRFTMPGAVCSFCLGEKRAGETFASGNVKLMEL